MDGFSANLQRGVLIEEGVIAERFRTRLIVGGLRYEYKLTDHLEFYFNGSYIIDNSSELRDNNQNTLFTIDEDSRFYVKTGIRFKI